MTPIFQHIEYLLLKHDCVIVPGLGAFIAVGVPAHFNREEGVIEPPSRQIMFNRDVTSEDGLLANSVSRKMNTTFEEARMVIAREVAILGNQLKNGGNVECGHIGTLSMDAEGNLVFNPASDFDTENNRLGFHAVRIKDTEETISAEDSVDEFFELEEEASEERHRFSFDKTFIRLAAVFIALIAVAIAVVLYPIPHDSREQRASVVPVHALMPVNTPAVKAEEPKSEIKTDTIEAKAISSHYLIVATFSSEKEANEYISQNDGNIHFFAVPSKKLCRVAIAESDNNEELREKLNSREVRTKFPDAWIWSRH